MMDGSCDIRLTPASDSPGLDAEQLDLEDQRRVRRNDAAGAARAVAKVRWNDQRALAADLHRRDAFIPALDHTTDTDREFERLTAIDGRVELRTLLAVHVEPAGVMHDAGFARLRRRAGAGDGVEHLQAGRSGHRSS